MCNKACIDFGLAYLNEDDIQGKAVIEVGSYDVNGSLRAVINERNPRTYLGVDIMAGPGVDEICTVGELVTRYGKNSFDVVINTEMMEHIQDWRAAISNLKNILRPGGVMILTTRSKGTGYHGYPYDFWRYEMEDMKAIFSDFSIEVLEADPSSPGVFLKAYKPMTFSENRSEELNLYSIVLDKRCKNVTEHDVRLFKIKRTLRKSIIRPVKAIIKKIRGKEKGGSS
jgi:SAM-dependent methyltransferase